MLLGIAAEMHLPRGNHGRLHRLLMKCATPVAASGRHSIIVRSMDADSRQGGGCGWAPATCRSAAEPCGCAGGGAGGCHATECTQSSWPMSTDSSSAVRRASPAWKRGFGAYLGAKCWSS